MNRRKITGQVAMEILAFIRDSYYDRQEGGRFERGITARPSAQTIADEFGFSYKKGVLKSGDGRQKSVSDFLQKIFHLIPTKYWKKVRNNDPEEDWFDRVNPISHPKFYALYNLLFDNWSPRETEHIIFLLVYQKFPSTKKELEIAYNNNLEPLLEDLLYRKTHQGVETLVGLKISKTNSC